MFSFGLTNLRRLKVVQPVELRRITLLVGRNSSGKSTFLRALPLLRQSLMTRTSAPILWFGGLVDFGSFKNAISDNDPKKAMSFSFGFDDVRVSQPYWASLSYDDDERQYTGVQFEVRLISDERYGVVVQSIVISHGNKPSRFVVNATPSGRIDSLTLNGRELLPSISAYGLAIGPGSITPDVAFLSGTEDTGVSSTLSFRGMHSPLVDEAAQLILPYIESDEAEKSLLPEVAAYLLSLSRFDRETVQRAFSTPQRSRRRITPSYRKFVDDLISPRLGVVFNKLLNLWTIQECISLIGEVGLRVQGTVSDLLYIGPARARSERYYRYQDLAVDEIDQDGENFAMFLNSLRKDQLDRLSDWIELLFGFGISKTTPEGHISINVKDGASETNIVDTGYGVSQILPVLGQIWWAANRQRELYTRRRSGMSILAIEQPELHLHPAHQALLADALAVPPPRSRYASDPPPVTHFLIETHSEALVNRLGILVAEKKLKPQEVQILVFEADLQDARRTNVRAARFSKGGELVGWPYGFFQPDR